MRKYLIILMSIMLFTACKSPPPPPVHHIIEQTGIDVTEPEFHIISIVIIQGELINTQFEALLKINNPNEFALDVSSLRYELHGNGMFWADGIENNVFHVPARGSTESKFKFTMNFINMNRRLLDDVIAMRQVKYNFKGQAQIQARIAGEDIAIPPFVMDYDIAGHSEVKAKSDEATAVQRRYVSSW
jgi:LEA14-like dessication related protein